MLHVLLVGAAAGAQLFLRISSAPEACKVSRVALPHSSPLPIFSSHSLSLAWRLKKSRQASSACSLQVLPDVLLLAWLVPGLGTP